MTSTTALEAAGTTAAGSEVPAEVVEALDAGAGGTRAHRVAAVVAALAG